MFQSMFKSLQQLYKMLKQQVKFDAGKWKETVLPCKSVYSPQKSDLSELHQSKTNLAL